MTHFISQKVEYEIEKLDKKWDNKGGWKNWSKSGVKKHLKLCQENYMHNLMQK